MRTERCAMKMLLAGVTAVLVLNSVSVLAQTVPPPQTLPPEMIARLTLMNITATGQFNPGVPPRPAAAYKLLCEFEDVDGNKGPIHSGTTPEIPMVPIPEHSGPIGIYMCTMDAIDGAGLLIVSSTMVWGIQEKPRDPIDPPPPPDELPTLEWIWLIEPLKQE